MVLKWSLVKKAFPRQRISTVLKKTHESDNFPATLKGWIKSIRQHKKVVFIDLYDGSSPNVFQIVAPKDNIDGPLHYGASISAEGKIVKTNKHRQGVEMKCDEIHLIGSCDPETYPKFSDPTKEIGEFRQYPHLRVREKPMQDILAVRSKLEFEIHRYFQDKGYLHIHTPIVTSNDCEGGCAVFEVNAGSDEATSTSSKFWEHPVHLSVSGQLHLEACAMSHGDVYTLSPVFRAEASLTRTHLAEFRMLEVERVFCETQDDIMDVMEDNIQQITKQVIEKCPNQISSLHQNIDENYRTALENISTQPYVRISYSDAVQIIAANEGKLKSATPRWGDDLNGEQENFLTRYHEYRPVFITDYPLELKPFYAYANEDGRTAAAVDLIAPFCGELCGGSVREHRCERLKERIKQQFGGQAHKLAWYEEIIKFGNAPHAGYGMGFDRLVRFITATNNIRDTVPFPRYYHSCLL